MVTPRITAAFVLICAVSGGCARDPGIESVQMDPAPVARTQANAPDEMRLAIDRGRRLTGEACAVCHATTAVGPSPMAAATPFREIVLRYPLDQLEEAFGEGLVTGHPAMPEFVFRASEIDDLIAYLETLKVDS
jgi:mono/diheme cytochrome c family protein